MSDILIKNMEMPKYPTAIRIQIEADGRVYQNSDKAGNGWALQKNVTATEIPTPHGRLGDLDRLEQMFVDIDNAPYSAFDGEEPFYTAEDAAQIIRLDPTIIEREDET